MTQNRTDLTQLVKNESRRLGFQLVGVTPPDPPAHLDVYADWISTGKHGEMAYLESQRAIERRRNPQKILPECKSILVLGINYQPKENPNKRSKHGKVATYALGDDYHDLIESRLSDLFQFIQAQIRKPIPHRTYSDTGPILERELAQRAGLGWIGKNTCLIAPNLGSYFLLGEILLGIELDPDCPFEMDFCGSCTRCIDNCPTGCILPNRTIDSSMCISYLTIEKRGIIPQKLRNMIGDWIFGCDICQDVCPWNLRFARPTDVEAFQPREFLRSPNINAFLDLKEETYTIQLQNSPLKRTKLHGLLRNASVAAGNTKSPELIPFLAKLLPHHPNAAVRSHCAWALGQFNYPENAKILRDALESEDNSETRGEIVTALNLLQNDQ